MANQVVRLRLCLRRQYVELLAQQVWQGHLRLLCFRLTTSSTCSRALLRFGTLCTRASAASRADRLRCRRCFPKQLHRVIMSSTAGRSRLSSPRRHAELRARQLPGPVCQRCSRPRPRFLRTAVSTWSPAPLLSGMPCTRALPIPAAVRLPCLSSQSWKPPPVTMANPGARSWTARSLQRWLPWQQARRVPRTTRSCGVPAARNQAFGRKVPLWRRGVSPEEGPAHDPHNSARLLGQSTFMCTGKA
mmetsp:Transcript_122725/g.382078  ORF Transcript_122725/g.382078 Transcript_122725/m.382078 type:complete len:246 (-) Transcript_122725:161-898(-)